MYRIFGDGLTRLFLSRWRAFPSKFLHNFRAQIPGQKVTLPIRAANYFGILEPASGMDFALIKSMKLLLTLAFVGFTITFGLYAETTHLSEVAKIDTTANAELIARNHRKNDAEVSQWKEILLNHSKAISLKEKIRALVSLAEVEGDDITQFLISRKREIDTDLKTGVIAPLKEIKGLQSALNRVIHSRSQSRVGDAAQTTNN
ncbi:MAG: hypothetical protein JWQ35_2768 [Bacteriovoracaceae bacterium]|nr:hypothetical protein [Bacteriovoracaceae bacterium]